MKLLAALRAWCGAHKKLTATIVGGILALIPDQVLDESSKKNLLGVIMLYVGAQGIADLGKERAKVEAAAPTPPVLALGPPSPPSAQSSR